MTPTPRVAVALAALSVLFLVVPAELPLFAALALAVALAVDAWWARRIPVVQRHAPTTLARGVPSSFSVRVIEDRGAVRVRQPLPVDLRLEPASEAEDELDGDLLARRRGRHVLPQVVARRRGPLGLAAWTHRVEAPAEVVVYPDLRQRDASPRRYGRVAFATKG